MTHHAPVPPSERVLPGDLRTELDDVVRYVEALRRIRQATAHAERIVGAFRERRPGEPVRSPAPSGRVAWPLASLGPSSRPAVGTRGPGEPEEAEPNVILLVDGDRDDCDLLARRLEQLGYAVLVAENGHQALGVLECEPVDLVLIDGVTPATDGEMLLAQRRTDERLKDVPVVTISAERDPSGVARGIEMGADDHLAGPFEPVLLGARVRAWVEKKRLRDREKALLAQLAECVTGLDRRTGAAVAGTGHLTTLRRLLLPSVTRVVIASVNDDYVACHRLELAVLVCNLRGFDTPAATAHPDHRVDVLLDYHRVVGSVAPELEATIGFLVGDGEMLLLDDPSPSENPARRVLRTGIALRDRMGQMTSDWRRRGYDVGFGVGVSLGWASVDGTRSSRGGEFLAIPTVVKVASRLCDQAGDGQVLLSTSAYRAVKDLVVGEAIDGVTLRGFRAPIGPFSVLSMKPPVDTTKER